MQAFGPNHVVYLLLAAQWTIVLSLIAFAGGGVLGMLLAVARVQPGSKVLRLSALVLMRIFQFTPLLMQLFLFYFGLSIFGFNLDAWTSVSIALIFYTGTFLGEIWRGCIEAVPRGQTDASKALALSYTQRLTHVILPQAMRIAVAPTVGFLVQVVKSTSLASIVGFAEIIRASQMVNNVTLKPLLVYTLVMAIYFAICWPLSLISRHFEKKLGQAHAPDRGLPKPEIQAAAA
ncbi:amino acid ABC transporter permease (plasmid) [Bosea sp. F3-2]|nr:amino acid ABC transporter permease [Bosea sp. F3-2]